MLTAKEKEITRRELRENFDSLGYKEEKVMEDLDFSRDQLEDAINLCKARVATPVDVWKLRDYLQENIEREGKKYYGFTVLKTCQNRWYSYKK